MCNSYMTRSLHGGHLNSSCSHSKSGSWIIDSPAECVISRAYGSFFQKVWPFSMTYLYRCPRCAPGTSVDQYPLPSLVSGCAVEDQPLKSPATATLAAFGAQTRKPTPPSYFLEPMPVW